MVPPGSIPIDYPIQVFRADGAYAVVWGPEEYVQLAGIGYSKECPVARIAIDEQDAVEQAIQELHAIPVKRGPGRPRKDAACLPLPK